MRRGQGRRLSTKEIETIKKLLANSELTIPEIAVRMGCSNGPVTSINRRFGIRIYNKKRTRWEVRKDFQAAS